MRNYIVIIYSTCSKCCVRKTHLAVDIDSHLIPYFKQAFGGVDISNLDGVTPKIALPFLLKAANIMQNHSVITRGINDHDNKAYYSALEKLNSITDAIADGEHRQLDIEIRIEKIDK